jgi:hypothetical protein
MRWGFWFVMLDLLLRMSVYRPRRLDSVFTAAGLSSPAQQTQEDRVKFAEQARDALIPLIHQVLELAGGPVDELMPEMAERPAPSAAEPPVNPADLPLRVFFTAVLLQAQAMREEEDVLALFFELSTTAFQGFVYPPEVALAIDRLLAHAEQMAFAMTASEQVRH